MSPSDVKTYPDAGFRHVETDESAWHGTAERLTPCCPGSWRRIATNMSPFTTRKVVADGTDKIAVARELMPEWLRTICAGLVTIRLLRPVRHPSPKVRSRRNSETTVIACADCRVALLVASSDAPSVMPLGLPFEGYWDHQFAGRKALLRSFAEVEGYQRGRFTDDTQLTLRPRSSDRQAGGARSRGYRSFHRRPLEETNSVVGRRAGTFAEHASEISRADDMRMPRGPGGNGKAMRTAAMGSVSSATERCRSWCRHLAVSIRFRGAMAGGIRDRERRTVDSNPRNRGRSVVRTPRRQFDPALRATFAGTDRTTSVLSGRQGGRPLHESLGGSAKPEYPGRYHLS